MNNYHQKLLPEKIYHLFSRAIGSEKLFLTDDNYLFFLQKLKLHTSPVCKIYCYSLLPNHFHLLAKIDDEDTIIQQFQLLKRREYNAQLDNISDFIMERFSNLLNSYTKAFNKKYNRKGALFMDYLKRSEVKTDTDLTSFVWYIHKNAVHHHLTKYIGEWPYDSYRSLLSNSQTSLLRNELLSWFGNKDLFVDFHQQQVHPKLDFIDF
ncbi:MAG: hypothetical protein EOP53_17355 [Sphingobacteriales bacterium]|nr:MAG: hypothetical protein EOP53_17355 [Sphingobacteriales bacterium]